MVNDNREVMILAGEASGDLHGSRLASCLQSRAPGIRLSGMGSGKMQSAGVDLHIDCRDIAVVGLVEILRHWPAIKRALRTIEAAIERIRPDVLVLIDYVEFNLRMAAVAKRLGIHVVFYVSPQVWAWRPERVHKIGQLVDMMAVIFPFEEKIYRDAGIPVRFVGHPLVGNMALETDREGLRQGYALDDDKKLVGLLPGSRASEIRQLLPVLLASAVQLNSQRDDVEFVLPVAPGLDTSTIQGAVSSAGLCNVRVQEGGAYGVMAAADCIVIASGTATLEAALLGVPMSIVYRVSPLSWWWMRRKLLVDNVGLANIVAEARVVPEFLQEQCTVTNIVTEVVRQLDDQAYADEMRAALAGIRSRLGEKNAAEEVATLVLEALEARATGSGQEISMA